MLLTGERQSSCTHVAYLSLVNRLANSVYWYNLMTDGNGNPQPKTINVDANGDGIVETITGYLVQDENGRVYESGDNDTTYYITADNLVYDAAGNIVTNMNQLITDPPSSQNEGYYIERGKNDIEIIGYHFEQNTTMRETDNNSETSTTTIVRVNCAYDYQADENGNGTYTVTLDHVAPIEAAAANYIHSIESFLYSDGKPASPTLTNLSYISTPFAGLTGTCSNNVSTINLSSVTLNPFTNAENQVTVQMAVNRSFNLRMKAAFVQASTLPGS